MNALVRTNVDAKRRGNRSRKAAYQRYADSFCARRRVIEDVGLTLLNQNDASNELSNVRKLSKY